MTYKYIGEPIPAIPSVPPCDLTDDEFKAHDERLGGGLLGRYYKKTQSAAKPKPAATDGGDN